MTPINPSWIADAERAGACASALAWLRAQPRTVKVLCADHPDWAIWAIEHGICPPDLLGRLATDEDWGVRLAVAQRTDDPALLRQLAGDAHWSVRRAVAERTDDLALLRQLAADGDWCVRRAVAERTDDLDVLGWLVADPNYYVRLAVAERLTSGTTPALAGVTHSPTHPRPPNETTHPKSVLVQS